VEDESREELRGEVRGGVTERLKESMVGFKTWNSKDVRSIMTSCSLTGQRRARKEDKNDKGSTENGKRTMEDAAQTAGAKNVEKMDGESEEARQDELEDEYEDVEKEECLELEDPEEVVKIGTKSG